MAHRRQPTDLLHTAFIRTAKRRWGQLAMADSTGQKLTYGRALVGGRCCSPERIAARTRGPEHAVGVLLPATVGGALANIAMLAAGQRAGQPELHHRRRSHAGGGRRSRHQDDPDVEAIPRQGGHRRAAGAWSSSRTCAKGSRGCDKIAALLSARLTPASLLRAALSARQDRRLARDDHLLQRQHRRPEGRDAHAREHPRQRRLARRRSFRWRRRTASSACCRSSIRSASPARCGFRCCRAARVAYHPNPMDAKTIGELAETYKGSMLISTPTFCQSYRAALHARNSSRTSGTRSSAPKSCASRWRRPSSSSSASRCSKATAARRWRRSSR